MKIHKIIISTIVIVFFLSITALPLVNSTCGNFSGDEFVPMCRMHTIGQVTNHLEQFRQQTLAIIVKLFNNLFFFYAFVLSVAIIIIHRALKKDINIDLIKFKNISPWDSLKMALAQGLVHNKILPKN